LSDHIDTLTGVRHEIIHFGVKNGFYSSLVK